jgi:hypothetical protein
MDSGRSAELQVCYTIPAAVLIALFLAHVQTHRQSLDLTQMKPVKGNIRLKDVSVIGDGK